MEKSESILDSINAFSESRVMTTEDKTRCKSLFSDHVLEIDENHKKLINKMSDFDPKTKTYNDWFNHYVKIRNSYNNDLIYYLDKCLNDQIKRNDIFIVNSLQKKFFDYVNCITFIKTIQKELMKKYD